MRKLKLYLLELRAPFFTAAIVPIILGTVIAYDMTQSFHAGYFLLALIGGILLHAGANVINDYFDHLSQNDVINHEYVRPFTGGSRLIQQKLLTPTEVLVEAIICLTLGSLIGLYLSYKMGWVVLVIGVFGVLSAILYVFPKINLVGRGIGEALIGINFGVLMTFGAFYVQTGKFSWLPIIASLPVALLISAVLYINEFQDAKADQAVGKNHLVVRLGKERAVKGYILMMLLTYAIVVVGVVTDTLPPFSLLALITLPIAFKSIRIAQVNYNDSLKLAPANASTIMNHLFTGLLLILSFVIDRALQ
ncbi:MAG: 1,4-dihydroxy-2-naphthoate octaprenyltransferase [candidate division KSB1 bacterium]|nr:1,4-dihydroxy-2-naphthoate octaprenyltransferase [candidate division KSB1 bacterium]MDZ7340093.1 1,4-dihydroxy-2-naphthoate octaprenyltransferase [candidate division KSB1 bacterium]